MDTDPLDHYAALGLPPRQRSNISSRPRVNASTRQRINASTHPLGGPKGAPSLQNVIEMLPTQPKINASTRNMRTTMRNCIASALLLRCTSTIGGTRRTELVNLRDLWEDLVHSTARCKLRISGRGGMRAA